MANLVKTNLFCKNKEDFNKLLMMLIQTRVLSQDVTMNAIDMETYSISFCSNWNVPFERIKTLSELVNFDFYIEHAGETVIDGVGEAVYHNRLPQQYQSHHLQLGVDTISRQESIRSLKRPFESSLPYIWI